MGINKIDCSASAVPWNWKKKFFFLSTKIKPKRQKLYVKIKLIFILKPFYKFVRLKRRYFRISTNHPEKQKNCREAFFFEPRKNLTWVQNQEKRTKMKIERPRLGGWFFVRRTSVVVVTDFFRVPCFKTGIAGRKRPASRKKAWIQFFCKL